MRVKGSEAMLWPPWVPKGATIVKPCSGILRPQCGEESKDRPEGRARGTLAPGEAKSIATGHETVL